MYMLSIKTKGSFGFAHRSDFACRTPQEALDKLKDLRMQDDKDSWVIASCLYECFPLAYNEEEMQKLIKLRGNK